MSEPSSLVGVTVYQAFTSDMLLGLQTAAPNLELIGWSLSSK